MKIISDNQPKTSKHNCSNVQFTSLYGELPEELKLFKKGFTEYVDEFMKDKPGYTIDMSVTKKNKFLLMKGSLGSFMRAKTQKALSEIKSLTDLKTMVADNHLNIKSEQDMIESFGKIFNLMS